MAYVLERRDRFPGVQFIETTQRDYPFGKLVAPNPKIVSVDYSKESSLTLDVSVEYPGLNGTLTVSRQEIRSLRTPPKLLPGLDGAPPKARVAESGPLAPKPAAPKPEPGPKSGSPDELKARLIQMCKDQARPYAYYVQSMGGASNPRLLYRVYASDGHQELVRGAIFNQLDTRALRSNIVAASDETEVDNRGEAIPISIIAPALLFDELELKRTTQSKEKLPLYPPPEKAATAIVVQ